MAPWNVALNRRAAIQFEFNDGGLGKRSALGNGCQLSEALVLFSHSRRWKSSGSIVESNPPQTSQGLSPLHRLEHNSRLLDPRYLFKPHRSRLYSIFTWLHHNCWRSLNFIPLLLTIHIHHRSSTVLSSFQNKPKTTRERKNWCDISFHWYVVPEAETFPTMEKRGAEKNQHVNLSSSFLFSFHRLRHPLLSVGEGINKKVLGKSRDDEIKDAKKISRLR